MPASELTPVNWSEVKAEDILAMLPDKENTEWEWKSAWFLSDDERDKSKKAHQKKHKESFDYVAGKTVSAFANTYGGRLVFGISDDKQLEECQDKVGQTWMSDWLATKLRSVVDRPVWDFEPHKVEYRSDPTKAIYVVEIRRSASAPHKSTNDNVIYYRPSGYSEPAPMSYIELQYSQETRAAVAVSNVTFGPSGYIPGGGNLIAVTALVEIENRSHVVADPYCLVLTCNTPFWMASIRGGKAGSEVIGERLNLTPASQRPLMPETHTVISLFLSAVLGDERIARTADALYQHLKQVEFGFRPISQNFAGMTKIVALGEYPELHVLVQERWSNYFKHVAE